MMELRKDWQMSIDFSKLRQIGAGACGSVFTDAGRDSAFCFKREDGTRSAGALHNDYIMGQRIQKAVEEFNNIQPFSSYLIPHYFDFQPVKDPSTGTTCNVLAMERIKPVSRVFQRQLVQLFCPPSLQETILGSDRDKDCLMRLYLGRSTVGRPPKKFFTLRNFPLHVDQFPALGKVIASPETVKHIAETMADFLAVMHWLARVDANDLEIVWGAPRIGGGSNDHQTDKAGAGEIESFTVSDCLQMWVIDFDCVRDMAWTEDGIDQAVEATFKNDPYYPRPGSEWWPVFSQRYLASSRNISQEASEYVMRSVESKRFIIALSRLFIREMEAEQEKRKKNL